MYGKIINNKLIVQNNKKIFCIELNEVEKRALEMQEVKEFEIQNVKNFSKLEDLKFLGISSVVYYIVDGIKVFKTMYPEKGYNELRIRFIEERKGETEYTIKGFSINTENGSYTYDVFVVEPQEGYIIFDDKLYNKMGGVQFKLDEYAAEKIEEYSTKFLKIVSAYAKTVGRSSYDYTDDIADSYNIVD